MLHCCCADQFKNPSSVCHPHFPDLRPGCCRMRCLGPGRFRGAAGVRANADDDYYHPNRPGGHDKNHNGKELLKELPSGGRCFVRPTGPLANLQGDVKEMKCVQRFAISVMSLASLVLVSACGTTSTTKETTTTYVPAPAAQVVAQAPAQAPPPPPTTTTSTSSDRTSDSTTFQPGAGTENTTSRHHSESTTVTPSN